MTTGRASPHQAGGPAQLVVQRWWLVIQAVVVVVLVAVLVEVRSPTIHRAEATIVIEAAAPTGTAAPVALEQAAATVGGSEVTETAEAALGRPLGDVGGVVDGGALVVRAAGEHPAATAADADATARAVLQVRGEQTDTTAVTERRLVAEQEALEAEIDRLADTTGPAAASVGPRRAALRAELEDNLDRQRALRLTDPDDAVGRLVDPGHLVEVERPEPTRALLLGGAAGALLGLGLAALRPPLVRSQTDGTTPGGAHRARRSTHDPAGLPPPT